MNTQWFLIVNKNAGNGNFDKLFTQIKTSLQAHNINYEFALTEYSKHEIVLVHKAIAEGFRNIISVGGDGTLHHVVNGIMTQKHCATTDITVGVIPLGTGNDWIKTHNIPKDINKAVSIIAKQQITTQDIGYLELENNTTAYFNNVAGIGYDGYVVNKLNKLKRFGGIAYLLSGLWGMLFYKKTIFEVVVNNTTYTTKCLMTLFGICRYSGGGMQLTDYKKHNDGLFDITLGKNLGLLDLIINLNKLYNGQIVNHNKVDTYLSNKLLITPLETTNQAFIEADGELIGTGKVAVSLIPKALNFVTNL